MGRNLEVKARVRDWEGQRAAAAALSVAPPTALIQEDTFFRVPRGRLKLRVEGPASAELIYYERADGEGLRASEYHRVPVTDPAGMARALGRALGVQGVVSKRRTLFRVGRTRVHFDEVEGLGRFLEIEVVLGDGAMIGDAETEARTLCAAIGVHEADMVAPSYLDLLASDSCCHEGGLRQEMPANPGRGSQARMPLPGERSSGRRAETR